MKALLTATTLIIAFASSAALFARTKRVSDAGLLQQALAVDGQARGEKSAGLLAGARVHDEKVVSGSRIS